MVLEKKCSRKKNSLCVLLALGLGSRRHRNAYRRLNSGDHLPVVERLLPTTSWKINEVLTELSDLGKIVFFEVLKARDDYFQLHMNKDLQERTASLNEMRLRSSKMYSASGPLTFYREGGGLRKQVSCQNGNISNVLSRKGQENCRMGNQDP